MTYLVLHGHFYQPPRENPWIGEIERERSAAPAHDWNERIHAECYRANAFSRVTNSFQQVARITNNYQLLSYNFGPTLLSWMERKHARSYRRILEADRESLSRLGHGNAIAQGYNHSILPLLSARDRRTQIRWGKADFQHRFGRAPEAMWLPETGANAATLDDLIDAQMKYVILAPHQAGRVRELGGHWRSVSPESLETGYPHKYMHSDGSGRSIAAFFYDGGPAQAIAFGAALGSSEALIEHMKAVRRGPLVHAATDGETYGHHHAWGDRTLTYALQDLAPRFDFEVLNYGKVLDLLPQRFEVELARGGDGRGTAWSCAHGLGRWMEDCGCHTGGKPGWTQKWRAPLRRALDRLNEAAGEFFQGDARDLFHDPWVARDEYIQIILDRGKTSEVLEKVGRALGDEHRRSRALAHLEAQKSAQLMFTSCGWFFNDISGIETRQVLKYAGRLIDLLESLGGPRLESMLLDHLSEGVSNELAQGTGADIYRSVVAECRVRPTRVVAHAALTSLADHALRSPKKEPLRIGGSGTGRIGESIEWHKTHEERHWVGRLTLILGRLEVSELSTGRKTSASYAAVHLGGADYYCAARVGEEDEKGKQALLDALHGASIPTLLRLAQAAYGPDEFALEHVLSAGREALSEAAYRAIVERFVREYTHLFEDNARTLEVLESAGLELPEELEKAAEFALGHRLEAEILEQHARSSDPSYERALAIADEIRAHGLKVNRPKLAKTFEDLLRRATRRAANEPSRESVSAASRIAELVDRLGVSVNRDRAQENLYVAREALRPVEGSRELAVRLGLDPALFG